jgi:hypothetical protein
MCFADNGQHRTVKVVDTLPPVISLHLKHPDLGSDREIIHISGPAAGLTSKVDSTTNKARDSAYNDFLDPAKVNTHWENSTNTFQRYSEHNDMLLAEQPVSLSSWIIAAAVGVAASGVAFIFYSKRNTASVIDV